MPDDFDKLTAGLDETQIRDIDQAAAIHAHYFHRLTRYHGIPEQLAAGFTETFIDKACVDPED